MSPNGSDNSPSNWHSIRPWAPTLSLAVREITSVSATFILSSTFSGQIDSSLASMALEAADDDFETQSTSTKSNSIIADALAKGLSVNVNGSAWPRAFIRIDDQMDEAVIIIYALMPGRQYDIELGLAPTGQPSTVMRRQVTTEEDTEHDNTEVHTDPESPGADTSSDPNSTPSTSPSRTVPGTPPSVAPQITLEDRLNQLQHTLSTVNQERETLVASLKSARKDAQKADSLLRAEIETLKRTSEKNTQTEARGKQKVLALQEAVKRAQNATKETEELTEEGKLQLPDLNAQKEQKEAEHAKIKAAADRARKEREDLEEKDRKRLEAMKAELAGLTTKFEKLGGKREKLESAVIPDLEEKLKETERDIELEEQIIARLSTEDFGVLHRYRQHSMDEPMVRPTVAPIQRPGHPEQHSSSPSRSGTNPAAPSWSPTQPPQRQSSAPSQKQVQVQTHTTRSNSSHSHLVQSHSNPVLGRGQRRGSRASQSPSLSILSMPSSTSLGSAPAAATATSTPSPTRTSSNSNPSPTRTSPSVAPPAMTSTLSSRAPAFEPSRSMSGLKGPNGAFTGHHGTTPGYSPALMPIQRPGGNGSGGSTRPNANGPAVKGTHSYSQWTSGIYGSHGHGQ
ncbi:hypothetical protein D9619_010909 [Psilocybe cf. subviscida]|uniref:Uncharacterized protein n=1 Tax=Psilocybe cf. subviscida TaxID=2480587 RepID=A0A8H5B7Z9_9AGAR|nr:hypothetical protein D9619_010909 [Psilocybe cf. subviscida]